MRIIIALLLLSCTHPIDSEPSEMCFKIHKDTCNRIYKPYCDADDCEERYLKCLNRVIKKCYKF